MKAKTAFSILFSAFCVLHFPGAVAAPAGLTTTEAAATEAAIPFSPFSADTANGSPRQRLLMDFGWKFHLGDDWGTGERLDKAGQSTGPANPNFSDLAWRSLNLPHDWAIRIALRSKRPTPDHGFKPVGPGFTNNSVGWYRRSFPLPMEDKDKRIWLEFDGACRDCRVFLNGYLIGHHESGYGSFRYDITDVANCGGNNILAVRVDASEFEGWFYEGAGIYRHVWLVTTGPVAIAPDGNFVYTQFSNNVPHGPATIQFETQIRNALTNAVDATVQCRVLDPNGTEVAKAEQTATFDALSLARYFAVCPSRFARSLVSGKAAPLQIDDHRPLRRRGR